MRAERRKKEESLKHTKEMLQKTLKRAERGKLFNVTDENIADVCIALIALIDLELNEINEHGEA